MPGTEAQIESNKPRQLPGHLLKQARERLNLAQKDIASQLNLQIDTIDALENDDRDRLPVAAYVRGYIRSYARLVKMDADMLVRLYEQESSTPPEIIPNITKPTQVSSRDKPVRAITYLVTFILALLLLAWLQGKYISEKKPDASRVQEVPAHAQEQQEQTMTPAAPVEETPLTLPPGSAEITESIIVETESEDVSGIATDVTATAPPVPEQITENLTTAGDKLQLILARDSWIEVYDAGRNKLYHGLARAGAEVNLAGKAPFSVLLGYAPGVEVRFNNEIFDTAPFANAGIARFTLGAADDR